MTTWYMEILGVSNDTLEVTWELRQAFMQYFIDSGSRPSVALFAHYVLLSSRECRVTAYYPPKAAEFAVSRPLALPCPVPTRVALDLLVGRAEAWDACFPVYDSARRCDASDNQIVTPGHRPVLRH